MQITIFKVVHAFLMIIITCSDNVTLEHGDGALHVQVDGQLHGAAQGAASSWAAGVALGDDNPFGCTLRERTFGAAGRRPRPPQEK